MLSTVRTAFFVATIAAAFAILPSARAQQAVTLHGAVQFSDEHAFNKSLLKFEELVKKYYGKPINFVLHRNSELGLEKDYFAYMNQGISVDYGIVSPAHMSTFSKAAPFIDAPFLFRDLAHWNNVLDADLLKPIAGEIAQKADVMLIGYAGGGVRNIFVNKPVRNLVEMKGLKVRVQGAPIWSRTFSAIGMSPTVIAYNEVYNAIQNGVIAAGENEAAGVEQMKFFEVAPNLSMTEHAITIRPICFSGKTFKKLPADLQAAIIKAGKEAGTHGRQIEFVGGQRQARRAREGRQAQARRLHRPRRDEEAGRSGDGGLRQGDRRRHDLRADQRHQVARRSPSAALAGRARSSGARSFRRTGFHFAESCATFQFPVMKKLIDAYCRLLTWLMVATVAILVVPVSLQIISRYTALIPSYIWTEELSRFLFIWMIMLGAMIGIKEGTHFEVDVWPELGGAATRC